MRHQPESEHIHDQAEEARFEERLDKAYRHGEPEPTKAPEPIDLAATKFPTHVQFVAPIREGYLEQRVTHFFVYYTDALTAASAWSDFWTTVTHDLYEYETRRAVSGGIEVVLNPLFGA
jgi:hypothetical protein